MLCRAGLHRCLSSITSEWPLRAAVPRAAVLTYERPQSPCLIQNRSTICLNPPPFPAITSINSPSRPYCGFAPASSCFKLPKLHPASVRLCRCGRRHAAAASRRPPHFTSATTHKQQHWVRPPWCAPGVRLFHVLPCGRAPVILHHSTLR